MSNEGVKPDRETILSLCEDYIVRYNLTEEEALGEPPLAERVADPAADALALAVREYLLEMDRSNLFIHFGKAKDRLKQMQEAVTSYYASKVGTPQAPGSNSTR